MTEMPNSHSDQIGLKRQSMVTAAALVELIGPWATGADPLNEQLADALTPASGVGLLPPGTRLPAERELARELALSRTTIVAAYDRLRLAGLARSRQGSGPPVATPRPDPPAPPPTPAGDTDTEGPVRIGGGVVWTSGFAPSDDPEAVPVKIGAPPAGARRGAA